MRQRLLGLVEQAYVLDGDQGLVDGRISASAISLSPKLFARLLPSASSPDAFAPHAAAEGTATS